MKNYLLITLLFFCISCKKDIRELYIEALNLQRQEQYEKAISTLNHVIEMDSSYTYRFLTDAYISRGLCKFHSRDISGAIEDFNYVIEFRKKRGFKDDPLVYFFRSQMYNNLKQYESAYMDVMKCYSQTIEDWDKIALLPPAWVLDHDVPLRFIRFERANIYYQLDSLENALTDINYCLKYDNIQDTSYYWRGLINIKLGEKEKACEDLQKAYSLGIMEAKNEMEKYCK